MCTYRSVGKCPCILGAVPAPCEPCSSIRSCLLKVQTCAQIIPALGLKSSPSQNTEGRNSGVCSAQRHELSGPSLRAIINLRFIFIGEFQSRLALTKQNQMLWASDPLGLGGNISFLFSFFLPFILILLLLLYIFL